MLLKITDLGVVLGGLQILEGINLEVKEGELVAVVGSNGAGKTTLLRTISGLNKAASGKIEYMGKDITNLDTRQIAELGIAMVPEGKQLFQEMTVEENLKIGAYRRRNDNEFISKNLEKIYEMFPVLGQNRNRIAGTFSGGEQQMLTIGRSLMCEPKLLMIDEMSLGLAPIVIEMLMKKVKELNKQGTSILMVEQNTNQVLKICDYGYVIETGSIALDGTGEALLSNEHVKTAYLGI